MALTVMITGASGALGHATATALERAGHRVLRCARPGTAEADLTWDLTAEKGPDQLPTKPDCVIHTAAAIGRLGMPIEQTSLLAAVNALGSWKVADWCASNDIRHLVLVSSAIVYGTWQESPKRETDPVSPWAAGAYAASKWLAEQAATGFRVAGRQLGILRLSSLYGTPYQQGLVQRLLATGRRDGAIRLSRPTGDAFHLLHVDDAAQSLRLAAEDGTDGLWNIGGPDLVSIEQIGALCAKAMSVPLEIDGADTRPRKILNWVDDSLARRDLGYAPQRSLPDAISEIYAAQKAVT